MPAPIDQWYNLNFIFTFILKYCNLIGLCQDFQIHLKTLNKFRNRLHFFWEIKFFPMPSETYFMNKKIRVFYIYLWHSPAGICNLNLSLPPNFLILNHPGF